jgi:hypothetical protein
MSVAASEVYPKSSGFGLFFDLRFWLAHSNILLSRV